MSTRFLIGLFTALFLCPVRGFTQPGPPLVTLTNLWSVPTNQLPQPKTFLQDGQKPGVFGGEILDVVVGQGRLWLTVGFIANGWNPQTGAYMPGYRTVFALDAATGKSERWTEALEMVTGSEEVRPGTTMPFKQAGRLDLDAGALWVFAGNNAVHRYDLRTRERHVYDVPMLDGKNPLVTALNGKVYLRSFDRILELNPADGVTRLLASSRRRPPANELDKAEGYNYCQLTTNAAGQVCLQDDVMAAPGTMARVGWVQSPDGNGWLPMKQVSWPVFGRMPTVDHGLAYDRSLSDARVTQVFSGLVATNRLLVGPAATAPRWPIPLDYPPHRAIDGSRALLDFNGSDLLVLAPPAQADVIREMTMRLQAPVASQSNAPGSLSGAPKGTTATLWVFHSEWEEPFVRHLELKYAYSNSSSGARWPSPFELSPRWESISEGLLICTQESIGDASPLALWLIPRAQITNWIETEAKLGKHTPRQQPVLLQRYDRDHKGLLDEKGAAALAADADFIRQQRRQTAILFLRDWDANHDGALDLQEFRAVFGPGGRQDKVPYLRKLTASQLDSAFGVYDADHSSRLEPDELGEILAEDLPHLLKRLGSLRLPPESRAFDRNGDGVLDEQERNELERVRKARLQLGLFQVYDLNGDGVLDAAEQEEFKKHSPSGFKYWQQKQTNAPTVLPPVPKAK